ncbi:hypothetical protein OG394_08955 [Kribbella sp. NBC_01245]|uniref:CG0192-related protein n=1 Tax=Kribbella sp. NBC_01245 TaxID=2903578 RepID=UPI002E2ACC6E|nr:hypothetical protein [Kribbella sp. NBC_01245]
MALIHRAQIRPTKMELIGGWLPSQSWYAGGGQPEVQPLGSYRFDDPAGEVGIDSHLVRADGAQILHVPMTYRAAPLAGGEPWLIGTTEHTVLGKRWVYDACGDPVYANALAAAILAGGAQAEEYFEIDGRRESRTSTAHVTGSGDSARELDTVDKVADLSCTTDGVVTTIRATGWELRILRVIDPKADAGGEYTLTGTWSDQETPALLATARLS